MPQSRCRLLVIASLWTLGACAGPSRLPADGPQTAQDVLARALARPLPKTLQGMARLDSYVDGKARKADILLRIARPDRAQFQALTPTLDMLAVLATDGRHFVSFERGADRCYKGPACPRNMARLIPIALPPAALVAAVLGRPPLTVSGPRRLAWDGARGAYRVQIGPDSAGATQELWIAPGTFRFLASVVTRGSKRLVSIAYDDLEKLGPTGPPGLLVMKMPGRKIDMSLALREIELDAPIEADAFAPDCPAGTVAIALPCEATTASLPRRMP